MNSTVEMFRQRAIEASAINPPRVHGNGFIQLDLDETMRLNVWGHPEIPHQSQTSKIHDHRFSFISHVIIGALTNIEYRINYDQTAFRSAPFDIYRPVPRQGQDTELVNTGVTVRLYVIEADISSS